MLKNSQLTEEKKAGLEIEAMLIDCQNVDEIKGEFLFILEKFKDSTQLLIGTKYITLSIVYPLS